MILLLLKAEQILQHTCMNNQKVIYLRCCLGESKRPATANLAWLQQGGQNSMLYLLQGDHKSCNYSCKRSGTAATNNQQLAALPEQTSLTVSQAELGLHIDLQQGSCHIGLCCQANVPLARWHIFLLKAFGELQGCNIISTHHKKHLSRRRT